MVRAVGCNGVPMMGGGPQQLAPSIASNAAWVTARTPLGSRLDTTNVPRCGRVCVGALQVIYWMLQFAVLLLMITRLLGLLSFQRRMAVIIKV